MAVQNLIYLETVSLNQKIILETFVKEFVRFALISSNFKILILVIKRKDNELCSLL